MSAGNEAENAGSSDGGGAEQAHEGALTCPYCQDTVANLQRIESGMKLRLQESAQVNPVPEAVCIGCMGLFNSMISKGAVLRSEQKAKEQNRLTLWKNRVQLVKAAKAHAAQKNFPDAAISYEKYLRVLEIIYEQKPGDLTPELFKNEARAQEMTVIASVYWDLMRIYDQHERYSERQYKAAEKLSQFVRFTPIYPQIMRKADTLTRTAKNREAYKRFLRLSNATRPRCFIATAAHDGYLHPTVLALMDFRDQVLRRTAVGRKIILIYYRVSPPLAVLIDRGPGLKLPIRFLLRCSTLLTRPLVWIARKD